MSLSKSALNTLLAGAVLAALAGATANMASAEEDAAMTKEKCYGVVKAGKNDCAAANGSHSCAAHSTKDGDGGEFIALPKGVCEKIVGGSTTPKEG